MKSVPIWTLRFVLRAICICERWKFTFLQFETLIMDYQYVEVYVSKVRSTPENNSTPEFCTVPAINQPIRHRPCAIFHISLTRPPPIGISRTKHDLIGLYFPRSALKDVRVNRIFQYPPVTFAARLTRNLNSNDRFCVFLG